jgi:hypothetical protein
MKLKSLILPSALLAAITITLVGLATTSCATKPGGFVSSTNGIVTIGNWTVDTNQVYVGIEIATALSVQTVIQQSTQPGGDTNMVPALKLIELALDTVMSSGDYSPTNLQTTLNNAGVGNYASYVSSGILLYKAFFSTAVQNGATSASPYIVPGLTGLRDGVRNGLGQYAALRKLHAPK